MRHNRFYILTLLALLALPFIALAQTDDAAPKDDRPSVTRGAEEVKYMGSVNGGMALLGFFLHTSHGVIFPDSNLYAGGSLQYFWLYGESCIDIAAHGRCFFPGKGRVQGYVGLEAGLSVLCPGYTKPEEPGGPTDYYPAEASFVITPALGLVINFKKISLDIGAKCRFSPQVTMGTSLVNDLWAPIPAVGIGLIF